MQIRELSIPNAFEITPEQIADDRGVFLESYKAEKLASQVGHALTVRQVNTSVSRRGVLRGVHFADVPIGQAKYVTVSHGAVLDFVVDIRVGSPTFGRSESVVLDDVDRRAVYLAEGLGHAFLALTDSASVSYLVSDVYRADHEHGIDPLDVDIALQFPAGFDDPILSVKDANAPSLAEAIGTGILPTWEACQRQYESLNSTEA